MNYELPNVPEDYVHRIGRTARAGATGHAVSLVAPDEGQLLRDIERTMRQQVPFAPTPEFKMLESRPQAPRPAQQGAGHGQGQSGHRQDHRGHGQNRSHSGGQSRPGGGGSSGRSGGNAGRPGSRPQRFGSAGRSRNAH